MEMHKLDIVTKILTEYPETRDSDYKLLSRFWLAEWEQKGNDRNKGSAKDFLIDLYNGNLTPPESVTRLRRKAQYENPELRGERYKERHEKQNPVKHSLGYGS